MKNPKRLAMYEFIQKTPACTIKVLLSAFAYGVGTLYSHLYYLNEFDHIRTVLFAKVDLPAILRQKKKYLQLLAQIRARGAVSVNDLKRSMNLHYTTVMYYLNLLEEVGVVTLEVTGKQRRVVISNSEILSKLNI